jgi:ketosteroid isomerase-like protein
VAGTDAGSIASRCLAAWTSGDMVATRALLDDGMRFVGPLGQTLGADEYVAGVSALGEYVTGADQHEVIVDGDDVCIVYDLLTDTTAGPIPCAGWYQVRDGKVTWVRVFFDPRPLLEALA